MNDNIKLYLGDCMEIMKSIPNKSVDCIITSPPYNLGGNFHISNRNADGSWDNINYGDYGVYKDSLDEDEYQNNQIQFLNTCYEKLDDSGIMFYNHKQRIVKGSIIHPLQWIVKSKFIVSQIVILDFGSTANVDKCRFFPVHEYLFVLKKNNSVNIQNNRCLTDVWKMKKVSRKISGHPATFHTDLPYNCITSMQNVKTVLDPYMGTGTVGVVCKEMGISFIGIEIDKKYYDIATNRIFNGGEKGKQQIQYNELW